MNKFDGVANTLFVPLVARINISKKFPEYFMDEKALELEKYLPQGADKGSSEYSNMASSESEHYKALFKDADVIGFDYQSQTPWEAKVEFSDFFNAVSAKYQSVYIVANSIGAFFTMNALADRNIEKAFFISPIVNMEKLIADMMIWANVTEQDLYKEKEIETSFGETLSWEYLCYVREHPVVWNIPTKILYGDKDNLTSYETMSDFASKMGISLTVMNNGEHWFHTDEQMNFLDDWICESNR